MGQILVPDLVQNMSQIWDRIWSQIWYMLCARSGTGSGPICGTGSVPDLGQNLVPDLVQNLSQIWDIIWSKIWSRMCPRYGTHSVPDGDQLPGRELVRNLVAETFFFSRSAIEPSKLVASPGMRICVVGLMSPGVLGGYGSQKRGSFRVRKVISNLPSCWSKMWSRICPGPGTDSGPYLGSYSVPDLGHILDQIWDRIWSQIWYRFWTRSGTESVPECGTDSGPDLGPDSVPDLEQIMVQNLVQNVSQIWDIICSQIWSRFWTRSGAESVLRRLGSRNFSSGPASLLGTPRTDAAAASELFRPGQQLWKRAVQARLSHRRATEPQATVRNLRAREISRRGALASDVWPLYALLSAVWALHGKKRRFLVRFVAFALRSSRCRGVRNQWRGFCLG